MREESAAAAAAVRRLQGEAAQAAADRELAATEAEADTRKLLDRVAALQDINDRLQVT
jgi:hypothetical protein